MVLFAKIVLAILVCLELVELLIYEINKMSEHTHPEMYAQSFRLLVMYSILMLVMSQGITVLLIIVQTIILNVFAIRSNVIASEQRELELNKEEDT